jgi:hypothetical protein
MQSNLKRRKEIVKDCFLILYQKSFFKQKEATKNKMKE